MRVRPELDPDVEDVAPDGPDITVYDEAHFVTYLRLLDAAPARAVPAGLPLGTPLPDLAAAMTAALATANVTATTVLLSDPAKPYAVVKIVSADFEDRAANRNWRPGWRSFDAVALL